MNLNEVLILGNQLMKLHGLTERGWCFELDNAKSRFGICRHGRRLISVSQDLSFLNDEPKVKDTILHEIAHALVGRGHGHDAVWKAKCVEIGAKPERCYNTDETNTPALRYYAICEGCGTEHQRAKRVDPLLGRRACRCQNHLAWNDKKTLTFKDRRAE